MYAAIRDYFLTTFGEQDCFVAMETLGISSVEVEIGKGPKIEWRSERGGAFDLSSPNGRSRGE